MSDEEKMMLQSFQKSLDNINQQLINNFVRKDRFDDLKEEVDRLKVDQKNDYRTNINWLKSIFGSVIVGFVLALIKIWF